MVLIGDRCTGSSNQYQRHCGNLRLAGMIQHWGGVFSALPVDCKDERKAIRDVLYEKVQTEGLKFFHYEKGEWIEILKKESEVKTKLSQRLYSIQKEGNKQQTASCQPPVTSIATDVENAINPSVVTPTSDDIVTAIATNDNDRFAATGDSDSQAGSSTPFIESISRKSSTDNLGDSKGIIIMDGNCIGWDDSIVSKDQLESLREVLEGEDCAKYIGGFIDEFPKDAADSDEEGDCNDPSMSYAIINGAVQIFVDRSKGGAAMYLGLRKLYHTKKDFIEPEKFTKLVEFLAVQGDPSLRAYATANLSILHGDGGRGPQPVHADTKQAPHIEQLEKFGILMLSKQSPGTIYYDMAGVPSSPNLSDIKDLWPDIPESLLKMIASSKRAMDLLNGYGQLLFTPPDKRFEPGIVNQGSIAIFNGSHAHCAPACSDKRSVLFFNLQPPMIGRGGYTGGTQVSKEKLIFLIYDELLNMKRPTDKTLLANKDISKQLDAAGISLRAEYQQQQLLQGEDSDENVGAVKTAEVQEGLSAFEKRYLMKKFFAAFKESASFGARDKTFQFEGQYMKTLDCFFVKWVEYEKRQNQRNLLIEQGKQLKKDSGVDKENQRKLLSIALKHMESGNMTEYTRALEHLYGEGRAFIKREEEHRRTILRGELAKIESCKDKEAMESVEADSMNVFLGGDYADTLEN